MAKSSLVISAELVFEKEATACDSCKCCKDTIYGNSYGAYLVWLLPKFNCKEYAGFSLCESCYGVFKSER